MTSRLHDQSAAQCNWLCMHWVYSGSVPRHFHIFIDILGFSVLLEHAT